MSVDPYHQVQSEIQSSLLAAEQVRASFLRIRSTAREGNEELEWARNEVRVELVWMMYQNHAHRLLLLSTLAQDNTLGAGNRPGTFGRKCQVCDPALVILSSRLGNDFLPQNCRDNRRAYVRFG
jgi:hypothetical protein